MSEASGSRWAGRLGPNGTALLGSLDGFLETGFLGQPEQLRCDFPHDLLSHAGQPNGLDRKPGEDPGLPRQEGRVDIVPSMHPYVPY